MIVASSMLATCTAIIVVASLMTAATPTFFNSVEAQPSRETACTNPSPRAESVPNFCRGTVIVTKVVNGGPNSPQDFTLCVHTDNPSVDGDVPVPATPPCAPGSGSGFSYSVKIGAIAISEPVQIPGYHFNLATCSGIVTVGQTVTCTATNTFTGP